MNPTVVGGALGAFIAVTLLIISGVVWAIFQSLRSHPRTTGQIVGIVRHPLSGWAAAVGILWGASTGAAQMFWPTLGVAIACVASFVIMGLLDGNRFPRISLPRLPRLPTRRRGTPTN